MKTIYLDHAAATPVDQQVLLTMQPYWNAHFYNPSATYLAAKEVRQAVDDARALVAKSVGIRPSEVIFTAGGTEANNIAIHGVMAQFSDAEIVVGATEHKSVLAAAKGFNTRIASVLPSGVIDLVALRKVITDKTVLISIGYVNNEIGTIQPLAEITKIINVIREDRQSRGIDLPLYFHTDACQAVNYLNVSPHSLGVDLMTVNGGKIYGPKQTGMLFVKAGLQLAPLVLGGGQERGLRSGTENVPGIVGFSAALDKAVKRHNGESKRLTDIRNQFISMLAKQLPDVTVNGSVKHRIANNVHITIPGSDNERMMMELDERGIQCAVGSACSASSDEPSHVLKAIGLTDEDAQASLRFTLGRETDLTDVQQVVESLKELVYEA